MDDRILEQTYQENLEERLIAHIADMEGIQYLDYKVLAQILRETEPERFY